MNAFFRLLRHPPRLWVPLLLHRAQTVTRDMLEAWESRQRSTFAKPINGRLAALLPLPPADLITATCPWLPAVSQLFLEHRFDWLGLGWRSVNHDAISPGLAGMRYDPPPVTPDRGGEWLRTRISPLNLAEAQRLWGQLDENYRPIDWQRDHRSGYRWNMEAPAAALPIYPTLGADIKQPWELARLQHLPLLALAYGCASAKVAGYQSPDRYVNEFRSTILDFLATNPPRYGVNWVCSMDIAIRIVNILVAADLFRAGGAVFPEEFERLLMRAASEHARHIRAHLERRPDFRANHYLANLAGLLFVGAYLNHKGAGAVWWSFARDEMRREVRRQFMADGANFEASTGYHRLSGEIAAWSLALICAVEDHSSLDDELRERIAGIGQFIRNTCRDDGSAPAIGDLDNGRLLKLSCSFELLQGAEAVTRFEGLADDKREFHEGFWLERLEQHQHLAEATDCFFAPQRTPATPETFLLSQLIGIPKNKSPVAPDLLHSPRSSHWQTAFNSLETCGQPQQRYQWDLPGEDAPRLAAYPDFGLYIVRTSRWMLTIRCGSNGQEGNGGHAHNDQLSLTLQVDGVSLIEDPGINIYHAVPALRNAYRSVASHFAPRPPSGEPASLDLDPFRLARDGEGCCLYFGNDGFIGVHDGFGTRVGRIVRWSGSMLQVEDYATDVALVNLMRDSLDGRWRSPVPISVSYGRPQKDKLLFKAVHV